MIFVTTFDLTSKKNCFYFFQPFEILSQRYIYLFVIKFIYIYLIIYDKLKQKLTSFYLCYFVFIPEKKFIIIF